MTESIVQRIVEIVSKESGIAPERIKGDADFTRDLQMDSLSIIEAGMQIEDEFGVTIPDEELHEINTVNAAVERVTKHLAGGVSA